MATSRTHNRKQRTIESGDVDVGAAQKGHVQISLEGAAELDRPDIQIVDGPKAMKKAEQLAFMEERVMVTIAPSTDPNAENPVLLAVNGIRHPVLRGVPTVVKRKFVERLARAKLTAYNQRLAEADPDRYNRLYLSTAVMYPFSVQGDSPAGQDWLLKILKEA